MTAEYSDSFPTGLYIPVEKRSLFMVAFEDLLVSVHNIVPIFGPATKTDSCEVKFKYLNNKLYKPESCLSDLEKALEFLRTNMNILGPRKISKKKRKSRCTSTPIIPQVITLEDESEIDLTNVQHGEQEVIVLDDIDVHRCRKTRQSSINSSVVDLTEMCESKPHVENRDTNNDVKILNVIRSVSRSSNTSGMPFVNALSTSRNSNRQQNNKRKRRNFKLPRTVRNSLKSESLTSSPSANSLPRKKRKLQDISNLSSSASSSTITSSNLSENTMKYYENISKVVRNAGQRERKNSTKMVSPVRNRKSKNLKKEKNNKSPTRKTAPVIVSLEGNKKRKVFTPRNSFIQQRLLHQRKTQNSYTNHNPLGEIARKSLRIGMRNCQKMVSETNSFNPNPYEVDLDGLRPIVIDGSNVAIGHGKGKFSTKGIKICVDYFAARGHSKIKIFLPQFRQEEFSSELLEMLKTKCDVVFTPSQFINGQRRTPYDDRFIVQYATEFGGVIVSTDNYRDITCENRRWQDTVAKRLLMFTWVDDFLMFPVDPLGRSGPTLEEFLRF